jgi:hypothetical protein
LLVLLEYLRNVIEFDDCIPLSSFRFLKEKSSGGPQASNSCTMIALLGSIRVFCILSGFCNYLTNNKFIANNTQEMKIGMQREDCST